MLCIAGVTPICISPRDAAQRTLATGVRDFRRLLDALVNLRCFDALDALDELARDDRELRRARCLGGRGLSPLAAS